MERKPPERIEEIFVWDLTNGQSKRNFFMGLNATDNSGKHNDERLFQYREIVPLHPYFYEIYIRPKLREIFSFEPTLKREKLL
jgi:hypothetical protein